MLDDNYDLEVSTQLPRDQWSEFVYNHPHGSIFQTPEMYDVYEESKNNEPVFIGVIDKEKNLAGILLALVQKQYPSIIGDFTSRAIIFGGPLVKNNNIKYTEMMLIGYNKLIKNKVIYSQIRNFWCHDNEKDIFNKHGFKYEKHLNIIVNLKLDEDSLWKNLKKSRKEGIRKAKRNNLVFGVTNSNEIIPAFFKLMRITYKNAKLPHPKIDFFYSLYNNLSPENLKFFTIKKENDTLIVLVALIFKRCLYAFFIGTTRDNYYLKMRPVDLLYWEVMCWAKKNGCTIFDWLGAGKPDKEYGVRKFKLQYGGEVVEWGRYQKIHKPLMMKIGKLGLKIWQKVR
jgi:lipid II:glycine glycyltransferase (peptidoglycan interpeptide bridge formation enzyme)